MDDNERTLKEKLTKLDKEHPLVGYTNASRVITTVRRMKAEKEMGIPIQYRTGFAISTKTGKGADEMSEREWNEFYNDLCGELKRQYPEEHQHLFPDGKN